MPDWAPVTTEAWRALWIRAQEAPAGATLAVRREFECDHLPDEGPQRAPARAFVASAGPYLLYINGKLAGSGPQGPVPPRLRYDCHDMLGFLTRGHNCLAVLASAAPGGGSPATLMLKAEVPSAGFPLVVGTDSQWSAKAAGWIVPSPEGGEACDPAAEPEGWKSPRFAEVGWGRAEVTGGSPPGDCSELIPRSAPPPEIEDVFPVGCLRESANLGKVKGLGPFLRAQARRKRAGRARPPALVLDASKSLSMPEVVLDFGRLVRGRPELDLETRTAGGEVIVSYGETPDLARFDRVRPVAGRTVWSPVGLRAFRYLGVAVRGAPKPVTFRRVVARSLASPAGSSNARFTCSDAKLAAAFRVARATLVVSTSDGIEERPGRPGPTVTGTGLRATALATHYLGGDMRVVRAALLDLGARDLPGAAVGHRASRGTPPPADVADALFWAIALEEHVAFTGDTALAAGLFDRLGICLATLERHADRTGVFHGSTEAAGGPKLAPFAAGGSGPAFLMCGAYHAAAAVARTLGRELEAGRWTNAAGTLGRVLRARFQRDDTGLFGETPTRVLLPRATTNAAALLWGGGGSVERARIADGLASGAAEAAPSALAAALLAEALFEAGRPAPAVDVLARFFSGMVKRGATECWEAFDPDLPPATVLVGKGPFEGPALAYGPGAVAGALMLRHVLGVRRAAVPAEVILLPGRAPFEKAAGLASLPLGDVRLQWRAARGRIEVKGRLPEGVGGTVAIPLAPGESGGHERFELAWGRKVFVDAGGRAVLPEEIESWSRADGEVRLTLAKGASFEVTRRPPRGG